MKLVKRLIEVAFVIFVITLFMKNSEIQFEVQYYGIRPIKVAFWELVTFCVALGVIIAALGDFITQMKWISERRRMIKTDKEHKAEVDKLNSTIESLQNENKRLEQELDLHKMELTHKNAEAPVQQPGPIDKVEST